MLCAIPLRAHGRSTNPGRVVVRGWRAGDYTGPGCFGFAPFPESARPAVRFHAVCPVHVQGRREVTRTILRRSECVLGRDDRDDDNHNEATIILLYAQ
jgi:hypothetical protein